MVDLLILTAISSEFTAIKQRLNAIDPSTTRLSLIPRPIPFRAALAVTESDTIVILQTGVGLQKAWNAIQWALEHLRPTRVVFFGVAGSLVPELRVGDVVVATSVGSEAGDTLPLRPLNTRWSPFPEPIANGRRLMEGALVSVERIIRKPAAKRAIHLSTGAVAVDMESLAVVEACQDAQIPIHVVRAISDGVDDSLPSEIGSLLDSAGNPRMFNAARLILRRPTLLRELLALSRQSKIACKTLSDVVAGLYQLPPPS